MKETALAHARAYDYGPWDPDSVSEYRTADCIQSLHPKGSIPSPFDGDLTQEQFYQALHFFGSVLDKSRFEIKDTAIDVPQRKVVLSLTGIYDLKAHRLLQVMRLGPAQHRVLVHVLHDLICHASALIV